MKSKNIKNVFSKKVIQGMKRILIRKDRLQQDVIDLFYFFK